MLDRDLEIVEVVLFKEACLPDSALNERFSGRFAVFLEQPGVERSSVHTNAKTHARIFRRLGNLAHPVVKLFDISGVHPHRGTPSIDGLEYVFGLEVNVGDDGNLALFRDDGQRVSIISCGNSNPNNVTPRGGQLGNLLQGAINVGGLGGRHRLDTDRVVASHHDFAHLDLAGLATRTEGFWDFG